jgi:hypothetical protein
LQARLLRMNSAYSLTATDETGQPLFPGCEEMAEQIDEYLEKYPQFLEGIAQQGMRRSQWTRFRTATMVYWMFSIVL